MHTSQLTPIRVTIFEDNHSLRIGLGELIQNADGYLCAGAFENCRNLLENIASSKPDVVLMDIGMPGIDGIAATRILRDQHPDIKILMQTVFEEDEKVFESIRAGASGYMLKNVSSARILEFIRETFEGGAPMSPSIAKKVLRMVAHQPSDAVPVQFNLSDREKEILSYLVNGRSYRMIGEVCFISIDTVRSHIRNIYDKLHVHSKVEAVKKAINNRIV
ncbi:MAG: response regulator transcription factor [Saprospiraceae bacterium]